MAQRAAHRPHKFKARSTPKQIHKHDHKHYWPYIPVLLLVIATFLVSLVQPAQRRGVLAYATSMSSSALLDATNQQRAANGASTLTLNTSLNAAAQAKANDMAARNYWSHNTPDGQEPWVFLSNVGYKYQKAGENLAYGFATSGDTVVGWMNSPTHKANMLDGTFTEVGFGYTNSDNYNSNGQQTIVVAMYGKPQVLAAQAAPAPATPTPAPVTSQTPSESGTKPAEAIPAAPTTETTQTSAAPVTSDKPVVVEPPTTQVARIQTLTNGNAPWAVFAVGAITGLALAVLLIKHAGQVRHIIRDGERFILHHPLLDTVLVGLVLIGTLLSQTSGFIK